MKTYSKYELIYRPVKELVTVFEALSAPSLEEMDGEYLATGLDQGGRLKNLIALLAVNWKGKWLGKAFHPVLENRGEGYNFFQNGPEILRTLRMCTYVDESQVTSGDSYHVDYSVFHRGFIAGSGRDEIRKISDGLYLGFGRFTYSERAKKKRAFFLLEGPSAAFYQME